MVEHRVGVFHDALAIDGHGLVADVPQSNMVDGSLLGEIDLVTSKHLISELLELGFLCQVDEQGEGFICEEVFGEVEEDLGAIGAVLEGPGEFLETLRILLEVFFENDVAADLVVMLYQSLPCLEISSLVEVSHDGGVEGILESEDTVRSVNLCICLYKVCCRFK